MSEPCRALVVFCHPLEESYVSALRERVFAGLRRRAAEVRLTDLYAVGFDPTLSPEEHRRHLLPGVDPAVQTHADDLLWCDTLVLVYPTWWSGQPAMLKGWFDRVLACDVAWSLEDGASRLSGRLHNVRRLVVVTSHGSSKLINALQGEGGKRTVTRSLRAMCHPRARTTWLALYGIDTCPTSRRERFLDRVERRLRRG